jgi:hypothetical protein
MAAQAWRGVPAALYRRWRTLLRQCPDMQETDAAVPTEVCAGQVRRPGGHTGRPPNRGYNDIVGRSVGAEVALFLSRRHEGVES